MSKLVISLVAFAYLGLSKTIIYTRAIDSLKPGDRLDDFTPAILCSSTFCMSIRPGGDGHSYLAMYTYTQADAESSDSVVWIANRDVPIDDDSAYLTFDHSGVLKITRPSGEPIIKYSSPQPQDTNNTVATLLDSGNFVVQQLHPDGSKSLLWQSFDYPTDTLLPGMKLGVNHKTGRNWSVISYFDFSAPASGPFSLEWEPKRVELVIRRRGQIYWASGELRNNKFDYIPEEAQRMYEYFIVSNKDEDSITFTTRNYQYFAPWKLNNAGILWDKSGTEIARANDCYGYNNDGGCQRWDLPTCRNVGEKFVDVKLATVKDGEKINASIDSAASSTTSDCQAACWSNCDCVAFIELYDNRTGCYFVDEKSWQKFQNGSGDNFHVLNRKPPSPPKGESTLIPCSSAY